MTIGNNGHYDARAEIEKNAREIREMQRRLGVLENLAAGATRVIKRALGMDGEEK